MAGSSRQHGDRESRISTLKRIGAYELESEIGRGATSIVYRAKHEGTPCAIKVMSQSAGQAVDLGLRFRREAATAARLSQPALIKIIELGEADGRPYLVMELAEGDTLDHLVKNGPLTEEVVIEVAKQLAGALTEVHRYGLVHCDIKPANIVMNADRKVKLLDFGFAIGATADRLEKDVAVGTLFYAAPEQIGVIDRGIDGRADLYALGGTLYECLSGQPPTQAETYDDLLRSIATEVVPDLRKFLPNMRPSLAGIVSKLLAKDPDDRYQSAKGLVWDLEHLAQIEESAGTTRPLGLGSHDTHVSVAMEVALVGRDAELGKIRKAWDSALEGKTVIVQVEGESGLGKTRLVRELIGPVRGAGGLVLLGKCQEAEKVPLASLREGLDNLIAEISQMPGGEKNAALDRLRHAAGDDAAAIKRLSRGLAQAIGDVPEPKPLPPEAERERFLSGITNFLKRVAKGWGAVLLVVDDVQWVDGTSLDILRRLSVHPDPAPLLIATTARNDAQSESVRVQFVRTIGHDNVEQIVLHPLPAAAVAEMVGEFLGGPVDSAVVGRIAQLTRGNPFAIGEYSRLLVDRGLVRPGSTCWRVAPEALSEDILPRDIIQLVVKRLSELSEAARSLLSMAAFLGNRFSVELLADAAKLRGEAVETALEEAVRATLLERVDATNYAFVHDKIREAASERLSRDTLPDIHQALAEALSKRPVDSAEYLYALARHWSEGRPERDRERARQACAAACIQAIENRDYETAYEFGRRALNVAQADGVEDRERMRMLEALGEGAMHTGRLDEAAGHFEASLQLATERYDRFRLQILLARAEASRGLSAWDHVYRAFETLGRPLRRTTTAILLSVCWVLLKVILLRLTGLGYGRAKGPERELRLHLSQAHLMAMLLAQFDCDKVRQVAVVVHELHNAHLLGPSNESAIATAMGGVVFATCGLRGLARRQFKAANEMALHFGNPAAQTNCAWYEHVGNVSLGELSVEQMEATVDETIRVMPGSWECAMAIAERVATTGCLGRTRANLDFCQRAEQYIERTNNISFKYNMLDYKRWELLRAGRFEESREVGVELKALTAGKSASLVKYVRLQQVVNFVQMLEEEELEADFEDQVDRLRDLQISRLEYYNFYSKIVLMYLRLLQFQNAAGDRGAQRQARRKLSRLILENTIFCRQPIFKCHVEIVRAALARIDGRWRRARKHVERAGALVQRVGSTWGEYCLAVERARLARATDDLVAVRAFANAAYEVALQEGWLPRLAKLSEEFGLQRDMQAVALGVSTGGGISTRPPGGRISTRTPLSRSSSILRGSDYLDALLQVSLASSSTLDATEQAQKALEELVRVLHAERALLFLVDPETNEMTLGAVRGVAANEIGDLENYSSTIVRKVRDSGEAIVVSGTEQASLLGSESAITFGLRSIIAAPILSQEEVIGVVYLDNRLARGFFGQEHVKLLTGIGSHIAIAMNMARAARAEAERRTLRRDMELTATVQTMFLPKTQEFDSESLRTRAFYRPAQMCGGDWWWQEKSSDGKILLLIGDVTGHGAPAAMITAGVSCSYGVARAHGVADAREILREINQRIIAIGERYSMTMCALEIDTDKGEIAYWNAGAPPVLVWRRSKERVESLIRPGSPLGSRTELALGGQTIGLAPGDRLFVGSDGLVEQPARSGRPIGLQRVKRMLHNSADKPIDDARSYFEEQLEELAGGVPQEDDITFVLIDRV